MSVSALAYAGLEAALNRYLDLDASARKQMEKLHGRVIAFEILGLARTLYLIPGPGKVQVTGSFRRRARLLHQRYTPGAGEDE